MTNLNYIQEFKKIFCDYFQSHIGTVEKIAGSFYIHKENDDDIEIKLLEIETNLDSIERSKLPRIILNTISKSYIRYLNVLYDSEKVALTIQFELNIVRIDKYYFIEFQLTDEDCIIKIKFNEIKLEQCKEPWYCESFKLGYRIFEKDNSFNSRNIIDNMNWITSAYMLSKHVININLPYFNKLDGGLKNYSNIRYSDCSNHKTCLTINLDIPLGDFLTSLNFINRIRVLHLKKKELRECVEYIIDISDKLYYFNYDYFEQIINNFETLTSICKSETNITLLSITDDFFNSLRSLGVYAKAIKSYEYLRDLKYKKLLYLDIN
jgi:hypothetical protein